MSLFIPVGLACKALLDWDHIFGEFIYFAGTCILAIGYIAAFTLIFISVKENKISQALVNLVRLSLTSYLLQLLLANWYGQRFSIGPVEWVLRKFVYWGNGRG